MAGENTIVRFGVFEVDAQTAVLRKSGIRIKLQDQPFQILTALLENPGEIVTREELRRRLWPEGTFVDFDHSLNASINKLREALGDAASNPRFLETVPRRGYRFIAPVEKSVSRQPADRPIEAEPRRSGRAAVKKAVLAAAAAVLIAAALFVMRRPTATPQWTPHVVRLTSAPGLEVQPSFSPDGNYVVYSGGPLGLSHLDVYVKQVGAEYVRRLTSNQAANVSPRWSPDGRHIAFARLVQRGGEYEFKVLIIPALGGPERSVTDARVRLVLPYGTRLLDWFPDSERLVVVDRATDGGACLYGLHISTGERWRLTIPPEGGSDGFPTVSPDGRRIAFIRSGAQPKPDVFLLDLDSGGRTVGSPQALTSSGNNLAPVWTPDGRELLFASGSFLRKTIVRMRIAPRSPAAPVPIAAEGSFVIFPAISNRWQLAYEVARDTVDLFRTELHRDGNHGGGSPFLSSTMVDHLPEYSPDGKRIAFVSNRSGTQQIWLADANGENANQLTSLADAEATWPRWSPDGRRLVFTAAGSVYVVSSDGGRPVLRFKDIDAKDAVADWSPDGEWLYFVSNRSGRAEIWRARVDANANDDSVQVTRGGGGPLRLSPDGRYIYFAKGNRPAELWRVGTDGAEESRVVNEIGTSGSFAPAAGGAYFIPRVVEPDGAVLMLLDSRTLARRKVASLVGTPMWGLTLSPDRRFVVHSAAENAESDLMMVDNFR